MAENICKGKKPILDPETCEVYLIGPVNLQSSLLDFMIQDELGIPCSCIDEIDPSSIKSTRRILFLVDGNGRSLWELVADSLPNERLPANCSVVFFNIRESGRDELRREVAARGIRGIFFEDASLESLLKGVREILCSSFRFPANYLIRRGPTNSSW